MRQLKILGVGNFQPDLPEGVIPWSTETHLGGTWELMGHTLVRFQERSSGWKEIPQLAIDEGVDLVWWTRTWGMDRDLDAQREGLSTLRAKGIPSIAIHLDKFWGLPRSDQLEEEPWFTVDRCFTADGGHQAEFAALGINHRWMPPGVYEPECVLGEPQDEYKVPVGFVGSWREYHPEWKHRKELVRFLMDGYGGRVAFWPRGKQVRGQALSDLYASVKVVVGDSCLLNSPGSYCSDRIPESLGRGAFLIHPHVPGVTGGGLWTAGEHLVTWEIGDWRGLKKKIDHYLKADEERERIRMAGYEWTRTHHTYTHRLQAILDTLYTEGVL